MVSLVAWRLEKDFTDAERPPRIIGSIGLLPGPGR
jgi:hypothetical protein